MYTLEKVGNIYSNFYGSFSSLEEASSYLTKLGFLKKDKYLFVLGSKNGKRAIRIDIIRLKKLSEFERDIIS